MKKIVKQVAANDVAQNELVVCLGKMENDWTPYLYRRKSFANKKSGFLELIKWVERYSDPSIPVRYVMEATGVYHEAFAYFLVERNLEVSIVLPNKISNYARTLQIKTVTDKTASEAIALFGLERKLDMWKAPAPVYRSLSQITRERDQIIHTRTIAKNQLHAESKSAHPHVASVKRIKARIALCNKQEKEVLADIQAILKSDPELAKRAKRICTIKGVGTVTAAAVLAETRGFDLIRNKKQLASYAGLDVKEKLSGTSVKGKPRISKRGNVYLRKAMYFPALAAVRHDERFKHLYERLLAKHGIKMKALVAVQRKILELMYILDKNQEDYDKDYLSMEVALVLNS